MSLLADRISESVIAAAAGMASPAALAGYHRWVPPRPKAEVIRLLHGLAGVLLAAYYTGRATIADSWRTLHYRLQARARG